QRAFAAARAQASAEARRARDLEAATHELGERVAGLERRLIEPAAGGARLHKAALRLEALDEDEIYPALLDLVRDQLGADACEVYALDRGRLEVRASAPPPGSAAARAASPPVALRRSAAD